MTRLETQNNFDSYVGILIGKVDSHTQEQMGSKQRDGNSKERAEIYLEIKKSVTEMKWSLPSMKTHNMRNSPNTAKGFRQRATPNKMPVPHIMWVQDGPTQTRLTLLDRSRRAESEDGGIALDLEFPSPSLSSCSGIQKRLSKPSWPGIAQDRRKKSFNKPYLSCSFPVSSLCLLPSFEVYTKK